VSARATLATALRVLLQLRRDPRTVALLLLVPTFLLFILDQMLVSSDATFERVGVPMLGLFPLIAMFLVTSITMLRERTTGTLERILTLPIARLDILAGYAIAFAVLAALQSGLVSLVGFGALGLTAAHSTALVIVLAIANAVLGMAFGLFVSAFARTEFQAVQFMPAFVLPQLLLCGLFVPRAQMAGWLRWVSDVLPVTYAYDALARAASQGPLGTRFAADLVVTVGATLLALVLGAVTLRRRTP
jgi:ABC-2 type transport system permease protein